MKRLKGLAHFEEATILVVDNDPEVGRYVVATLAFSGFKTLLSNCGQAALTQFLAKQKHIDLVLADVVINDLAGPALASALRIVRSDVRILYMSGYRSDHLRRYKEELSQAEVLSKPFTPQELISSVRRALGKENLYNVAQS